MKDVGKTKGQLVNELVEMRQRLTELEASKINHIQEEKVLRESEEHYRNIIDDQLELVCRFLPDRTLTFINESFCHYFDKKREDLIGHSLINQLFGHGFVSFVLTDDRRRIEDTIDSLSRQNHVTTCEHRFLVVSGEIRWVQWTLLPIVDKVGNPIEFQAVGRDTTVIKQAEEELRRSEEKYRLLVLHMPDIVWTTDDKMRIVYISDNVTEVCGYTPEEEYKMGEWMSWYERVHPDDVENAKAAFAALIKGEKHYDVEYRFRRKDGKWIWLHDRAVTTYEKDGTRYRDGLLSDITERKQAQTEKIHIIQKAQLNSRLASIGKMASGIAHEINSPLASVIGLTDLIMRTDLPQDVREHVEIINDASQRVISITDGLLTFARQKKAERKYVNINEIIVKTLALRAYELENGNIKVTTQLDTCLPSITADGGQLQQVFLNIIINAETEMKLTSGKGHLSIKTETVDGTIRIFFKDNGQGIAKKNQEKIFEPFFTTRDVGQGTGLGLSVCHGIITEHNGRIYAKSQVGKGATFVVELPMTG